MMRYVMKKNLYGDVLLNPDVDVILRSFVSELEILGYVG